MLGSRGRERRPPVGCGWVDHKQRKVEDGFFGARCGDHLGVWIDRECVATVEVACDGLANPAWAANRGVRAVRRNRIEQGLPNEVGGRLDRIAARKVVDRSTLGLEASLDAVECFEGILGRIVEQRVETGQGSFPRRGDRVWWIP